MSRQELIKQLKQKNPKINNSELQDIIEVFTETIKKALMKGDTIEIRGWGRFSCRKLKEQKSARNPSTNELIYVPERTKIKFKASKKLNKFINE